MQAQLPIAVLGAGPVGLAAAAHLLQRGLTPLVFEAGASVGANLASYRQVRLFSPWQYNIDRAARALLDAHGWEAPAEDLLPTAGDLIDDYLAPLAALPALAPQLRLRHRVLAIARAGIDKVKTSGRELAPFVIRTDTPEGVREFQAAAVIDATGTWSQPNPMGANGLPALGEDDCQAQITYGMPDIQGTARARYAGKRVLVVGAGHSAAGNLIALATLADEAPGTSIVWAVRGASLARTFGGGEADQLPARGLLGTRLQALQASGKLEVHRNFRIQAVRPLAGKLQVQAEAGVDPITEIDEIVVATGARPDLIMAQELRLRLDPWLESTDALAPLIDPNLHSCGSVRPHGHRELAHPEPGYYAVGAKSYGRAPNFLMATGYEQVRSVVAALAGDMAAADDVQLELPETGVCVTRPLTEDAPAAGGCCGSPSPAPASCCGGPAPEPASACCVKDADLQAAGKGTCGSRTGTCA
ncbi:FAD-dependent oxidoreductase [Massilia sp. TS11]|uniref:FAD-dependent oxidoreductase n=1 Tax=Massilia sp. TS11 TaxID=2908003 RepID=UPI001EDB7218|nr:FAD-dependent oxidoreductase [Massilia sp. TS11]MCG2584338.1 NAD(P)-binding domain-containing protein [Massilia sp. TS11]